MIFDASSIYKAVKYKRIELLSGAFTVPLAKYEIGNAVWKEIHIYRRITKKEGIKLLNIFNLVFELVVFIEPNIIETIKIASKLKATFYDASYIQIAKMENQPLVTEDIKLRKIASKQIKTYSISEL